ncbi:phage terminase large subunit, partial [Methylophaga sp. UBA3996]
MLMNPALRDFWATKSRYKALRGGRDSSKSHDAAGNAIRIADYCKVKFLCVRQFQNRIDDSVYTVLKDKIAAFGLQDRFYVTNNRIKNLVTGSEFMFYGIQRNLTDIKSVEGADILWIEEAEGLTEEQMKVLRPTIRKEGSEIWLV